MNKTDICPRCRANVATVKVIGTTDVVLDVAANCYILLEVPGVDYPMAVPSPRSRPAHRCHKDEDELRRGLQLAIHHLNHERLGAAMNAVRDALKPKTYAPTRVVPVERKGGT